MKKQQKLSKLRINIIHKGLIVKFNMIHVEGGTFTMGATPEQGRDIMDAWSGARDGIPAHQVTLNDYYIGETQVTQELWRTVMGKNPSSEKGNNLPVEKVSWDDCQKFIAKLNDMTGLKFRLPTEAEWEFAARGGNKSKGYKYSGSNDIESVAHCRKYGCGTMLHPVRTKLPNELGIYDMSGNVWEWCNDWYKPYSSRKRKNPTGPRKGSHRVYRGGSWFDLANRCRVSCRRCMTPDGRDPDIGLRLAL